MIDLEVMEILDRIIAQLDDAASLLDAYQQTQTAIDLEAALEYIVSAQSDANDLQNVLEQYLRYRD